MATFRVETVFDAKTGLYFVEVYYPDSSANPFVVSKPIYQSHEQAAEDAIRIFRKGLPDQPLRAASMTKYGKTIQEKNGFKLVEVVHVEADGSITIVGYAILDPEGSEIGHFPTIEKALEEFKRLTEDYTSPPPPPPFK